MTTSPSETAATSTNNINKHESAMDLFSSEIERYYTSTRPYSEEVIEKEKLCKYIIECGQYLQSQCEKEMKYMQSRKMHPLDDDGPYGKYQFLTNMLKSEKYGRVWEIFTFGSMSWGTSCRDSDIDMAIFVNFQNTRKDKKYLLFSLAQIIGENDGDGLLIIKPLLNAKYPIIRITQNKLNIKIDVSIADRFCKRRDDYILSIINKFEDADISCKKLIVFIKFWSKQKGINNSYQCYLNSFGYTLLVIKFLQVFVCEYDGDLASMPLCDLVFYFFKFYGLRWKPETHSICICDPMDIGTYMPQIFDVKQFNMEINGYCYMEIIDPMDVLNNVAQRVGLKQTKRIKLEFKNAYELISKFKSESNQNQNQNESIFSILIQNNNRCFLFNKGYKATNSPTTATTTTDGVNSNHNNKGFMHQLADQQNDQNWRDGLLQKCLKEEHEHDDDDKTTESELSSDIVTNDSLETPNSNSNSDYAANHNNVIYDSSVPMASSAEYYYADERHGHGHGHKGGGMWADERYTNSQSYMAGAVPVGVNVVDPRYNAYHKNPFKRSNGYSHHQQRRKYNKSYY